MVVRSASRYSALTNVGGKGGQTACPLGFGPERIELEGGGRKRDLEGSGLLFVSYRCLFGKAIGFVE